MSCRGGEASASPEPPRRRGSQPHMSKGGEQDARHPLVIIPHVDGGFQGAGAVRRRKHRHPRPDAHVNKKDAGAPAEDRTSQGRGSTTREGYPMPPNEGSPVAAARRAIDARRMVIGELQDKADEFEKLARTYEKEANSLYESADSHRERALVLRQAITQIQNWGAP